jgi:hypothetical protein
MRRVARQSRLDGCVQMERRGVLGDDGGRWAADREALIRSAISNWRVSLIDFTGANRLLDFRPGGTGMIEVARPAASDVFAHLTTGGTLAFRALQHGASAAAAIPPTAPCLLDSNMDPGALDAELLRLMRCSNQQHLDRGLPVLHLAFGTLTWADRDGTCYTSPLLLVPARLVAAGPRQPPMLEATGDDPSVNPALSLKLSRCLITLPKVGDLAGVTLSGLLDAVRAAVATQRGWVVSETVALSCFALMQEAMYHDLVDHQDLVAAHPVVRSLAVHGLAGAAFNGAAGHEASAGAACALPPLILPADSSQRACVTAALAGRSFTIDGPPGTGKSQTIANITGALLHAGKTVLVVSGKAAALEVVARRLTVAGLGPYLLELHSHKGTRKEVAVSLAKALDTLPATPAEVPPANVAGVRPDQLTAYAEAVNRVRDPLGYSLHDVLAVIASPQAVPAAPAAGCAAVPLTAKMLGEIRRTALALAAAWQPATQGRSFPWRGVTEHGSLDDRLYQAASALEALADVVRVNRKLADAAGLTRPSGAPALARLLDHLEAWPQGVPDRWLTADTLDAVDAAVAQLAAALTAIAAREHKASQAAGIPWSAIPQPGLPPADGGKALAAPDPACAHLPGMAAGQITGLAREFSAATDRLENWLGTLAGLAGMLGLHAPVTFTDAADLLTLAGLAAQPDSPERPWLSAAGQRAASNAAQVLHDAHRALATAKADASTYFTPDALRHDVAALAQRFTTGHRGLGTLSGDYRAARKTVRAFTREGIAEETAQEHLGLAAAWRHAAEALAAAEARHAALLGPYYTGRATDFAQLGRALAHAATAVRCARGQDLSRAAGYICQDAAPDPVVTGTVTDARQQLPAWQAALAALPAAAPRPELLKGTITGAIGWLRARLEQLQGASEYTRAVGEAVGGPLTFGQARQLVALREAADAAHAQLAARDATFQDLLGPRYAGAATDLAALRDRLEWARRLRAMITGGPGPLTMAHLDAAESAIPTAHLASAAVAWQQACAVVLAAFHPQRRQELAAELDDYRAGRQLLETLFNDASGPDQWHAYQTARAALAAHGLDAAVDLCITEQVEPPQVPQVIERALLLAWADHHVRTDPALAPLQRMSRDALADEYQRLDQAMTAAAAKDIICACNARRPRGDTPESAVIRREAAKDSNRMPVRDLLGQTRRLTQAIKPCFLMPPPAVSQHLPANMRFDVVIFDEASQISPGDAINCIYRGSALILAGDQQQLPPGRPFGTALAAGEGWPTEPAQACDPESILDLAKASGAFGNLTLRWHYRSRHEALIAYSNAAFYGSSLLPNPGSGPEAGLELFYGEGIYRSRTSRDNPDEAALVAQRVVHHHDARPGLSLGVVTFSQAQADAIETALGKAREQRPDLDRFFTTDRLRGFFVKTAGTVQGDERDVLIVSIGYGPDENGQVKMDFGPLTRHGGWRRLNVAITRARHRLEIITSIRPSDIPDSATSEGLKHLRRYLSYAAAPARAYRCPRRDRSGRVAARRIARRVRRPPLLAAALAREVEPRAGAAGGCGVPSAPVSGYGGQVTLAVTGVTCPAVTVVVATPGWQPGRPVVRV